MKVLYKKTTNLAKSHYLQIVAFAAGVGTAFLVFALLYPIEYSAIVSEQEFSTTTNHSEQVAFTEVSTPNTIRIPSLEIEAEFEKPLGLNHDGTVQVPKEYETVGWYKYGPKPGELGPSVVLGHVDSYEGPAVFWSIGQLDKGDSIYIDDEDGQTIEFRVTKLERHQQSSFPTEKVYGDIDHAGLRLITCSGIYNKGTLRYSHNLIVFAERVGE